MAGEASLVEVREAVRCKAAQHPGPVTAGPFFLLFLIDMTTYTFRINGPRPSIDAQTIGEELQRIESRHGLIDPHVVLDASRPDDAPLHDHFEWDDAVAGEKWRLEQSRALIRSVEIIHETTEARVPAFVNVSSVGGYVSAATVQNRPDLYHEALREYRSRIAAAATQLEKLEELAPSAEKPKHRKDRKVLEQLAAV